MRVPEPFTRAWKAIRDPLVTTRGYDVASALTWFFYAGWGLGTALSDLSVFQSLTQVDRLYPQLWGGSIGILSLAASIGAVVTLFLHPASVRARVQSKRAEIFSLCGMLGLLVVYPATLIFIGDPSGRFRPDIISLSFSYFPFAVFRIVHLRARMRGLYALEGALR